jgi:hypothetical protein
VTQPSLFTVPDAPRGRGVTTVYIPPRGVTTVYIPPHQGRTPHARQASYEAAQAVRETAATDTARIAAYLAAQGDRGATDEELHRVLGIQRHEVPARRQPLCRAGRCVSVGRRPEGHDGKRITVWVLRHQKG